MRSLGRVMTHFRLVTRMARATGVDLVGARMSGDLTQDDWAGMVQTCRRCGWTGHCRGWLGSHDTADCAPDTCPNRARFDRIKARGHAAESM